MSKQCSYLFSLVEFVGFRLCIHFVVINVLLTDKGGGCKSFETNVRKSR